MYLGRTTQAQPPKRSLFSGADAPVGSHQTPLEIYASLTKLHVLSNYGWPLRGRMLLSRALELRAKTSARTCRDIRTSCQFGQVHCMSSSPPLRCASAATTAAQRSPLRGTGSQLSLPHGFAPPTRDSLVRAAPIQDCAEGSGCLCCLCQAFKDHEPSALHFPSGTAKGGAPCFCRSAAAATR